MIDCVVLVEIKPNTRGSGTDNPIGLTSRPRESESDSKLEGQSTRASNDCGSSTINFLFDKKKLAPFSHLASQVIG